MAYPTLALQPTSNIIGLTPPTDTQTTQNFPLGTICTAVETTVGLGALELIYLKGVASTAAGDVVVYDPKAGTTVRAVHTTAARGPVAVALSANVASQYGWYAIGGVVPVNSGANTVAAGAPIYLTSTAATVDDAVVATDKVDGMFSQAANSGGFTYCLLERPAANGNG